MNKQQLRDKLSQKIYGWTFEILNQDQQIAINNAVKLIDQYAYEYAERVIGEGELHVSHVCPQDSIPCLKNICICMNHCLP